MPIGPEFNPTVAHNVLNRPAVSVMALITCSLQFLVSIENLQVVVATRKKHQL